MNFNVTKTGKNIITNINGVNFSILFTPDNYSTLLKMQDAFDNCTTRQEATELLKGATEVVEKMTKQLWEHEEAFEVVVENMIVKSSQTGEMFLVVGDKKVDVPFPESLRNRIQEAIDSESDFMPIVKAWIRFLRNPNLSKKKAELFGKYLTSTYTDHDKVKEYMEAGLSEDLAIEKATFPDVSLTKEGFLCCYKYVQLETNKFDKETGEKVMRYKHSFNEETGELELDKDLHVEDFFFIPPVMGYTGDEFTSGGVLGHRVQIGEVHELPSWDMVDCDDNHSYVPGMHIGGLAYVSNFGGKTAWLMECFVDPSQIGAFDHNGQGAIRCKSYYVHNAKFAPVRGLYHSSTYARLTDEQWASERAQAIEEANKVINAIKERVRMYENI